MFVTFCSGEFLTLAVMQNTHALLSSSKGRFAKSISSYVVGFAQMLMQLLSIIEKQRTGCHTLSDHAVPINLSLCVST